MSSKTILALVSVLTCSLAGAAMASDAVDCSNAANQNKEECVRAKVNINQDDVVNANHNNDVVNCSNAADRNRSECARAKFNRNH